MDSQRQSVVRNEDARLPLASSGSTPRASHGSQYGHVDTDGWKKKRRKRSKKIIQVCLILVFVLLLFLLALRLARYKGPPPKERVVVLNKTNVTMHRPAEVTILLDASGSMNEFDWKAAVKFARQAVLRLNQSFSEKDTPFSASIGQFSTDATMEIDMTNDTDQFADLKTWACARPADSDCINDSERINCMEDPMCIVRRRGFTEIGAALCGSRSSQGIDGNDYETNDERHMRDEYIMRSPESCRGGAASEFPGIYDDSNVVDHDNLTGSCNVEVEPMQSILIVSDGKPMAPGVNKSVFTTSRPLLGLMDAVSAAKVVKEAPHKPIIFGIMVGKKETNADETLYSLTDCCDPEDVEKHYDKANAPQGMREVYTKCAHHKENTSDMEDCEFYIHTDNFDQLLSHINEVVEVMATVETMACTEIEPTFHEKPGQAYRFFGLLLVPVILQMLCPFVLLLWGDKNKKKRKALFDVKKKRLGDVKKGRNNPPHGPTASFEEIIEMSSALKGTVCVFAGGSPLQCELTHWTFEEALPEITGRVVSRRGGKHATGEGFVVVVEEGEDIVELARRAKEEGATGMVIHSRWGTPTFPDDIKPCLPAITMDGGAVDSLLEYGSIDGIRARIGGRSVLVPRKRKQERSSESGYTEGVRDQIVFASRFKGKNRLADDENGWVCVVKEGPDLEREALRAKADGANGLVIRTTEGSELLRKIRAGDTAGLPTFELPAVCVDQEGYDALRTRPDDLEGCTVRERSAVLIAKERSSAKTRDIPVTLYPQTTEDAVNCLHGRIVDFVGGITVAIAGSWPDVLNEAKKARAEGFCGLVVQSGDREALLRRLRSTPAPRIDFPVVLMNEADLAKPMTRGVFFRGVKILDEQDGTLAIQADVAPEKPAEPPEAEAAPAPPGSSAWLQATAAGPKPEEVTLSAFLLPGVPKPLALGLRGELFLAKRVRFLKGKGLTPTQEVHLSLEEAFAACDKDRSGALSRIKMQAGLWGPKGAAARQALKLPDNFNGEELQTLFEAMDYDGSGQITLDEMIDYYDELAGIPVRERRKAEAEEAAAAEAARAAEDNLVELDEDELAVMAAELSTPRRREQEQDGCRSDASGPKRRAASLISAESGMSAMFRDEVEDPAVCFQSEEEEEEEDASVLVLDPAVPWWVVPLLATLALLPAVLLLSGLYVV